MSYRQQNKLPIFFTQVSAAPPHTVEGGLRALELRHPARWREGVTLPVLVRPAPRRARGERMHARAPKAQLEFVARVELPRRGLLVKEELAAAPTPEPVVKSRVGRAQRLLLVGPHLVHCALVAPFAGVAQLAYGGPEWERERRRSGG